MRGLRARGGYELEIKWANGSLSEAHIVPQYSGTCSIRVPHDFEIYSDHRKIEHRRDTNQSGVISFEVQAARAYELRVI